MKLSFSFLAGQLVSLVLLLQVQGGTVEFEKASTIEFSLLVREDANAASLVVIRTGDLDKSASARFATFDQTTVAVIDYVATSGLIVFAPGEMAKAITIPILNDGVRENLKEFRVKLESADPQTVVGSKAIARVGIDDNDAGFNFGLGTLSVYEDQGSAEVPIRLENDGGQPLSVSWRLLPVEAKPGEDYTDVSGTLIFAAGERSKTILIPIINNGGRESTERFRVELFNATGGAAIVPSQPLSIVIFDNDTGVQFEHYPRQVPETDGSISIRVLRGGDLGEAFTVIYYTTNWSATAGADYAAAKGTLQFAANETAKTITVPVLGDWLAEGDESFELLLTNPSAGIALGDETRATILIRDDERALSLDFGFRSDVQGQGKTLAILPNGYLLVGGSGLHAGATDPLRLVRLLPDGRLDPAFGAALAAPNIQFGGEVTSILALSDGRILVAGHFNSGGQAGLARLHPDGSLDGSFKADSVAPGTVNAIVRLSNGKLIVGGASNNVRVPRLLQLSENGSLEADFSSPFTTVGEINALVCLPDGGLLVGGWLNSGQVIVRLGPDGAVDQSFKADIRFRSTPVIYGMARLADGRIYIAGQFDNVNGQPRTGIARLQANGALDETFVPPIVTEGRAIVPHPNGGAFVAGLQINSPLGTRRGIALLSDDGSLVSHFNASPGPSITPLNDIVLDERNRPIVVGTFSQYDGLPWPAVARLVPDSSTNKAVHITSSDPSGFNPPVRENSGFHRLLAQRFGSLDGAVSVTFTITPGTAQPDLDYLATNGVIRFEPGEAAKEFSVSLIDDGLVEDHEGFGVRLVNNAEVATSADSFPVQIEDNEIPASLDGGFTSPFVPVSAIDAVAVQPDGKVLVAGRLTRTVGQRHEFSLARLTRNGQLETIFETNPLRASVKSIALEPDGKVIAAGYFIDPVTKLAFDVARFHADGSVDKTFVPASCACFTTFAIRHTNGKILLIRGGQLVRLNTDGTSDQTFQSPQFSPGFASTLLVTRDGRLLVGGSQGVLSLNENGSRDESFTMVTVSGGPEPAVRAVAELSNGKLMIAGDFQSVHGARRVMVARLMPDGALDSTFDPGESLTQTDPRQAFNAMLAQPDGKVILSVGQGWLYPGWRSKFVRLNSDGSLDPSFRVGAIAAEVEGDLRSQASARPVMAMALQSDGSLIIGGELSQVNGEPRPAIARLRTQFEGRQSVGFASADYVAGEAIGHASITLSRVGDVTQAATVMFSVRGETATEGLDFIPATGTVTFAPLEITKSFSFPLLNDGQRESDETVLLRLHEPQGALLDRAFASLRIADDERPGSLDFSFAPKFDVPSRSTIAIILTRQPDRSLRYLISSYDPYTYRTSWLRLAADGSVDPSFSLQRSDVWTLAGLPDGKLIGTTETNVFRLNADSSLDPTFRFEPGELHRADSVFVFPDGTLLLKGLIVQNDGGSQYGYFRLLPNGALDSSFTWPFDSAASIAGALALPDGRLYVCGYFPGSSNVSNRYLARLLPSGAVDRTFNAQLADNARMSGIALDSSGRLIAGGNFRTEAMPSPVVCARFLENGHWDPTFQPTTADLSSFGITLHVDSVGRILLAGGFTEVNGVSRGGIARLNSDGALDLNFDPGQGIWSQLGAYWRSYGSVRAFAEQTDGQIVVAGEFNRVNGAPISLLARLNGDSTARFSEITWSANGTLRLTVIGKADAAPIVIESSIDLQSWTPIFTNGPAAQFTIEDREALGALQKFYRCRRVKSP